MKLHSAELASAARSFGRWWLSELRSATPAFSRLPFLPQRPRAEIRPGRTSTVIHRIRDGQIEEMLEPLPTAEFTAENWMEVAELTDGYQVSIVLAPPLVHTLALKLPKAARGRLPAAVPLQLRDHSPLDPSSTAWGVGGVRPLDNGIEVSVLIARQATLDGIVDAYGTVSRLAPPVYAEHENGRVLLRPGEQTSWRPSREALPWLVAAALVIVAPFVSLGVVAYEQAASEARVSDLQESAAPILQSERWLRQRADAARALRTVLALPPATTIIDTLADRLPEGANLSVINVEPAQGVSFEVVAPDPDATRRALFGSTKLVGLHELNEFKGPDGSAHLRFTTAARP